jgi:hypothetical protein
MLIRRVIATGLAVMLVAAGWAAYGAGYGKIYPLPANGILEITNLQANATWKPKVVAVQCPDFAARTVTVSRANGAFEYPVAQAAATARSYAYEFEADYWFALSNVLKVAVSPATTGLVEVIYE